MKKYILAVSFFLCLLASAQQISFQRNFQKGNNAYITTFTELKSMDIIVAYTLITLDTSHIGPHTLELHLMKLDKNGYEIWDRLVKKDTTRFDVDRYTTQNIDEQGDGSLVFDITFPYGDKNIAKYDANGNLIWEKYTHISFGDYNIYTQFIKQRGRHIALSDGSVLSLGASFSSTIPRATLSIIDANSNNVIDHPYYNGYFNDGYYYNSDHVYTVGVEQLGSLETLVLGDIKTNGGVNFLQRITHRSNEKILATSMFYTSSKLRIAESLQTNDTTFHVNVYEYNHYGTLLSVASHKVKCAAVTINLSYNEVDWVLSNKCNSDAGQTIQRMEANNQIGFSFTDNADTIILLKKLHDNSYLFAFGNQPGLNLWKINNRGTLQSGTLAEGCFAPNPAKDYTSLIASNETFNHALTIKLYDMLGNTLRVFNFEKLEPVTLNLGGIREGTYVYTILTDEGVKLKGKLVIAQKN